MAKLRVAINGYGRIGRSILRAFYERNYCATIDIVAINELAQPEAMLHLTKYDSTHGRFMLPVSLDEMSSTNDAALPDVEYNSLCKSHLCISDDRIALFHEESPDDLPWRELNIDIVLECSGVFSSRDDAKMHLDAGAKKVLFSQPAVSNVDKTVIYGINHHLLTHDDVIVSNGSCTTNCVVPIIDALDKQFTLKGGTITTIHSSMNDQPVIDAYHNDLRRTRAASQSIIPVDTKLA